MRTPRGRSPTHFWVTTYLTLLSKLHSIGFSGNTLHWLSDFLSNRTQRVKINTTESEFSEVRSGVPQGSVIGPILFSIFVNDIFENMNASFGSLFADDAKIFTKVNTGEDGKKLQDQLDKADLWATSEQMEFNGEKCAVMHCGKKNPRCGYTLGGYKLKEVKHQKDLGITFSENMGCTEYLNIKIPKDYKTLGIINRTFSFKSIYIMKNLYIGLVRPHLDFCAQVWSPFLRKDIDRAERIQRRATKMIPNLRSKPYEERLLVLNLTTLEDRRKRGDMIETYKIINGHENIRSEQLFQRAGTGYSLRRHSQTLFKKRFRLDIRKNFFSNRVVNDWNKLDENTVIASSVNVFKNRYDDLIRVRNESNNE